jgi:hypothetical protein
METKIDFKRAELPFFGTKDGITKIECSDSTCDECDCWCDCDDA